MFLNSGVAPAKTYANEEISLNFLSGSSHESREGRSKSIGSNLSLQEVEEVDIVAVVMKDCNCGLVRCGLRFKQTGGIVHVNFPFICSKG